VTGRRINPPSDDVGSVCESLVRAVLVLAIVAGGCGLSAERGREYTPDMTYSVAYDSFAPKPATRNCMTLQTPVRGTIPRGFLPLHYTNTAADAERAGRELSNPYAHVPSAVEQGHRQYETFCQVCHGARGDGDGPIVPLIPNPPAYSSERVRAMPAGRLFHVMTYGSGRMPCYASQLPASDRWRIATLVDTPQPRPEAARR